MLFKLQKEKCSLNIYFSIYKIKTKKINNSYREFNFHL